MGLRDRVLFNDEHIYDFVERQKAALKEAFARLTDEEALSKEDADLLKQRFSLQVPTLKPDQWTADERTNEVLIYVPFDGDPSGFKLAPSASNGTVAVGEVVGKEILLRIGSGLGLNVAEAAKREIANLEWRLSNLRGSTEYLNQQLDIALAECTAARRRAIENRAKARQEIGIPRRQPVEPVVAPAPAEPKRRAKEKPSAQRTPEPEEWDVFVSHASPDKAYVRPLVRELENAGVKVWFDERTLGWGDQLRPGINRGLVNSRYAIVVLSKSFLAERKWTEHEFNGLFAREELGKLVILPIWHGVEREDILRYDPGLADRLAKISRTDSYVDIVHSVLERLGRAKPESANGALPPPITVDQEKDTRELVAYAWYEQRGPGAQKAKIFLRKSSFMPGWYVLIDEDKEHDGPERDVATRFFAVDRWLQSQGYVRMQFSNLSGSRAFEL